MSKLAEWVMEKQSNAIMSIAFLSILPFVFLVAGILLALVVLRKGFSNSIPVLTLGCLPSLAVWFLWGDIAVFLILLQVIALSCILRETVSWGKTLIVAMLFAIVGVYLLPLLMSDTLYSVLESVRSFLEQLKGNNVQGALNQFDIADMSDEYLFRYLVVSTAVTHMVLSVICLFFGRLLQSRLYNPNGLREEMWQLKLPAVMVLFITAMRVLGETSGEQLQFLAFIVGPIILMVGIALIHGICAKLKNGKVWLIAFYIVGLVMFGVYIINILLILIIIDSFINIRNRIPTAKSDFNES
ncbi:hypothetical protein CBF23_005775 [Marinomonas agarivorans]|nr:hypothetical protein CBF23_005775 [Marinomonas agarivorans]